MLQNILNLNGVQKLNRNNQSLVYGGYTCRYSSCESSPPDDDDEPIDPTE